MKRNISLKIEDNPDEEGWYLKQNDIIENVKSIARGKGIDDIERLIKDYPLPKGNRTKIDDWEKCKGEADAYKDGKKRRADIHWYQAKNIGKVEHKVKSWIIQIKGRK